MAFNLNRFKGNLKYEGARPTLFQARIAGFELGEDFSFTCKSAQLPGKTLGIIEIPYFGRKIKAAGDQTFAEWTVTVINEEDFQVRNKFEYWMSTINSHENNERLFSEANTYKRDAEIIQYGKIGEHYKVKTYNFKNMWPSDISPIDVSWESNDAIEEFTVTLQYDWWESDNLNIVSV